MIERNVQPGVLLALRAPSQYKRQLGEDTSAAICTAVHEIGVGTHVEGQRLPENGESDGLMIVVDIETVDSAGLIIKTAPTENFVLVKVPSSPIHPKIPINAITTKGWVLVTAAADPFLGETHWIPGCFGGSTTTYFCGPIEDENRFRMVAEGYQLSEETLQQLLLNGVELKGQSSFSDLRIGDLLSSGGNQES